MDLSKILTRDLDKFIKNYLLPDRGLLAAKEEEADTLLEPAALWPLALLSPPSLTMGLSKILARDLDKFIENYLLPDRGLLAAEKEEADTLLELEALWPLALLSPPSLTMDLSKIPARDLDKFIENYLLPDTRFREEVRQAIDIICAFLKEMCFLQAADLVRVSKVVKGGSLGKGTTLKGRSDADLVVFLSHLRSFQEQFDRRKEFIQEIRRHLEACQEIYKFAVTFEVQNPRRDNPRALSFVLRSPLLHSDVEFDVLPAFDVLGQVPRSYSSDSQIAEGYRPHPQIYIKLIQECEKLGKEGEFSSCFTELQRGFLKQRPTKVKSLVRLVKHWYQKCKEKLGKPLPQQYALELLTVYAWERGCKETYFKTAQGFQTVLKLVQNYKKLCIYWEKYYDFDNPVIAQYLRKQLRKPRPVILDPADPTGNLGGGDSQSWPRLAQEAEAWLSYPCFKNADGSPVGSWYIELEEDSEDDQVTYEYWIDECEQHCGHFQQYHTPLYNTPHYNAPRYNAPRYDTPRVDENQWCVIL